MKIQVIFYSMYGHVHQLAEAVVEGAKEVAGAEVSLYQVAELVPDAALERTGAKKVRDGFASVPIATPAQLADADAIIFGSPTRFGNMTAQMRNFLDQTGGLWAQGKLIRNQDDSATYFDPQGQSFRLSASMSVQEVASLSPYIAQQWQAEADRQKTRAEQIAGSTLPQLGAK